MKDGMTVADLKGEIYENKIENRYLRREIRLNKKYKDRIGAPDENPLTTEEMKKMISENKSENRLYRRQIREILRAERKERRLERLAQKEIKEINVKAEKEQKRLLKAAEVARNSGLEINEEKLETDVEKIGTTAEENSNSIRTKTEDAIKQNRLSLKA